jgi:DNA polymerase III epsilon subunit-like protein
MDHTQPRLSDISFVAFDTETTDLFPIMRRLVEIGAVRFRSNGHELAALQRLIDPHVPIPEHIQPVHGVMDLFVGRLLRIEPSVPRLLHRSRTTATRLSLIRLDATLCPVICYGMVMPPFGAGSADLTGDTSICHSM